MRNNNKNNDINKKLARNSAATPDFVELTDDELECCLGGGGKVLTFKSYEVYNVKIDDLCAATGKNYWRDAVSYIGKQFASHYGVKGTATLWKFGSDWVQISFGDKDCFEDGIGLDASLSYHIQLCANDLRLVRVDWHLFSEFLIRFVCI